MGYILDTPSGKFKTLLVDTVEKLELPLAHMIPELTANILVPFLMMVYLFILDWRIVDFVDHDSHRSCVLHGNDEGLCKAV